MAWKETERAAATLIRRRYQCDVCEHVFEDRVTSSDAPLPDCPRCPRAGSASAPLPGTGLTWRAPMPGLLTTKSKAIDYTQKMAEEVYGLTDMNDNQRAGDIAYKGPAPMSTSEQEAAIRQMVEAAAQIAAPLPSGPLAPDGTRQILVDPALQRDNFWNGAAGGAAQTTIATEEVYKPAAAAARAQGVEPLSILEQGRQSGSMPMRIEVVGAETDIPQALVEAQARTQANPQTAPRAV